MTIPEFKKVGRLLKQAYRELEEEAIQHGVDLMSSEYEELMAMTRELVLSYLGFTLDEYREIRTLYLDARNKVGDGEFEKRIDILSKTHIPTADEIIAQAHEVAKEYIKPPQIIHQIVRETTIEKPTIINQTNVIERIEKIVERVVEVPKEVEKAVESPNESLINPKENIGIFIMPDFRKLAMGLQEQIDALRSTSEEGASDLILEATGTVDDSNLDFTFTQRPSLICINGFNYRSSGDNVTWTWSGNTATLSIPVGTGGSIYGLR